MSYVIPRKPVPKIALEEHFISEYFEGNEDGIFKLYRPDYFKWMKSRIVDLTDQRLKDMDDNNIEIQVMSLTVPGVQGIADTCEAVEQAKKVNDFLAEVVALHPNRFAGFAALPCQSPDDAANELERAVTQLGFKGAMINGHTNGEYLDHEKFRVIWERAEHLDVPIYLHPGSSPDVWKVMEGYPELSKAMWGWGVETATHALRLILSGLFDEFPRATLVLGHMGEMLPFFLTRLDDRFDVMANKRNLTKPISQYIRENVMVTTSGVNSPEALTCTQLVLGTDRIMFSVDYPYQCPAEAVNFIESAPLNPEDRMKICYSNAKKLLNL